jgi:crotonobetainyl-CoA:carnitine CoA-transferase CaiB-like acyl-CoA transferase
MVEVEALIAPVLARIDREAAVTLLNEVGIACGRLSTLDEMECHPQARHVRADSPTGPVEMMARGVRFSDQPDRQDAAIPSLGAHSAALRAEFHSNGRRRA